MRPATKIMADDPPLDLETLREVLQYALSDTRGAPRLAGLKAALEQSIAEIDALEPRAQPAIATPRGVTRFIPRIVWRSPKSEAAPAPTAADRRSATDDLRPRRRSRIRFGDRDTLQRAITEYFRRGR